ncbi:MAG: sigma-70 family RNA polymerase sigma factor [Vicinamibacterales bacterium]
MPTPDRLAEQFEAHRPHTRMVAYRLLGSTGDADDAVQEAWLRLSRRDGEAIDNLRGWLTTVVARVCLDMLRARTSRREDSLDTHVPDPIVQPLGRWDGGVEAEVVRADALGLAVLVVLESLEPAERLAFVLHDVCGLSFDEIAPIVDRSVTAARQLASRARRRVQDRTRPPDADLRVQRQVVEAFLAAVQAGDIPALAAVLDPGIVLRADGGAAAGMSRLVRGADSVVAQAVAFSRLDLTSQVVLVNGHVGVVSRLPGGRLLSVIGYTVSGGKVVEMDVLADPERLSRLDLSGLGA